MLALIQRANDHLQRTAIVVSEEKYTYQNLLNASHDLATLLLDGQSDLAEDRIAFLVPPGFDYVKTQWAIWRAGGIAVPLCTQHPLPSIQYVLEDTAAKTLVVTPEYVAFLRELAATLAIRMIVLDSKDSTSLSAPLPTIEKERSAMILYTSGTTSLPKGVVTTHANIEAQITTLVKAWEWQSDDHILCVLPLHHVHGIINVMSCALWSGACVEFLPKFSTTAVFELFLKKQINLFMAVPTIYYKLIAHWEKQALDVQQQISDCLSAFRLMVSGSAALPISVLEKWKSISQHTLLERYGMTEIGMAVSNSYRDERIPGHIGRPLPGVELRLVDEQNQVVATGEQGEIQIKGPAVFKNYWNKPAKTKEAFTEDGWFRTGDMAILNNGYYRILGRSSVDIIKSGGYKISALEIEEVLRTHSQIKDCAVVGIPDEEWGEVIVAGLVLNDDEDINQAELTKWLKTKMPAYRLPRKFLILADLPRNTLGKVTKK